MGSDIQSPAVPAKGYDFFMSHTAGLTPLEIPYPHSKSLLNLEVLSLLRSATRTCSLVDTRYFEGRTISPKGAVIA
jgi:hypothetical protein